MSSHLILHLIWYTWASRGFSMMRGEWGHGWLAHSVVRWSALHCAHQPRGPYADTQDPYPGEPGHLSFLGKYIIFQTPISHLVSMSSVTATLPPTVCHLPHSFHSRILQISLISNHPLWENVYCIALLLGRMVCLVEFSWVLDVWVASFLSV